MGFWHDDAEVAAARRAKRNARRQRDRQDRRRAMSSPGGTTWLIGDGGALADEVEKIRRRHAGPDPSEDVKPKPHGVYEEPDEATLANAIAAARQALGPVNPPPGYEPVSDEAIAHAVNDALVTIHYRLDRVPPGGDPHTVIVTRLPDSGRATHADPGYRVLPNRLIHHEIAAPETQIRSWGGLPTLPSNAELVADHAAQLVRWYWNPASRRVWEAGKPWPDEEERQDWTVDDLTPAVLRRVIREHHERFTGDWTPQPGRGTAAHLHRVVAYDLTDGACHGQIVPERVSHHPMLYLDTDQWIEDTHELLDIIAGQEIKGSTEPAGAVW